MLPRKMLPRSSPDGIHIAFDDHRLVNNAGLILPDTLVQHLGLPQLVQQRLDLGNAPGRANTGDKIVTLVASALAGGDCIDDAAVLRAGGVGRVLGCVVKAPSTLGTFLRSFRWGHVRQLDRVSRQLLAQAWATDAGPGDAPLHRPGLHRLRDLWAVQGGCATPQLRRPAGLSPDLGRGRRNRRRVDGTAAPGPRHHRSGRQPLPARDGEQGAPRRCHGSTHDARRQRLLRPRHLAVCRDAVCRDKDVRCSITARQHASLRSQIDAIPEADWTPIPYWMEGAADVAETTYAPFESKPDAATVRLIVRRVKPTPGSQLALFANYSYHAFITDQDGDTLYLEADHRRHAEIENAIRDLKYGVGLNHLPAGRFPANPEPAEGGLAGRPGDRPQPGTLDNARRPGRATGNHQDPQAALLRSGRTAHPLGPASHPASAPGLALGKPVQSRPGETARPPAPSLTAPDPSARLSTGLAVPRQAGTSVSTAAICPADLPLRNHLRSSTTSVRGAHSPHPAESLRIKALQPLSRTSHPCLGQRDCIPSVDSGLVPDDVVVNDLGPGIAAMSLVPRGPISVGHSSQCKAIYRAMAIPHRRYNLFSVRLKEAADSDSSSVIGSPP